MLQHRSALLSLRDGYIMKIEEWVGEQQRKTKLCSLPQKQKPGGLQQFLFNQ